MNFRRQEISLPPKGWRKAIPVSVKLQVIVNQRGLGEDGEALEPLGEGIEFDHRPPLHEREFDAAADDTKPAANDPRFIVARRPREHRGITGQDVSRMAKVKRLRNGQREFSEAMGSKTSGAPRARRGTIKGRGFAPGKRPLQGRPMRKGKN